MNKIDFEKTKSLAAGGKFRMDEIPVRKVLEQAQYIEKSLLPAVERKNGKASADYQFFEGVYKSLLYAIILSDRQQSLVMKVQQTAQFSEIHRLRAENAERELTKYATMEDLIFSGCLDHIAKGVVNHVQDLITNK
jgi:hypothetical protein